MAYALSTESEESYITYNMLKVTRHLFRWTKEVSNVDYYERALTNGVFGVQKGTNFGFYFFMFCCCVSDYSILRRFVDYCDSNVML
ncbi:unnamed protein product [Lathyrus sativus]|nr:unnamed protein product [Lathyrus sativus]